jgi:hypothetical protein
MCFYSSLRCVQENKVFSGGKLVAGIYERKRGTGLHYIPCGGEERLI